MQELKVVHSLMQTLNIATLDLNLLRVFDAIVQEGSIVRAADRLGMSQPAASHALARLRHALGDELFIRTGQGMQSTVQASRLAKHVRQALAELETGLRATVFDPGTSERRFAIAVDNYCAVVLAGPLLAMTTQAAPHVRLTFRPSGTLDVEQMLDNGELDLVLGGPYKPRDRFAAEELFADGYVALRRLAPGDTVAPLTIDALASSRHLHLSSTQDDTSFVDRALAEHGLSRSMEHSMPLLACEAVLAQYDALVVMRRAMAAIFAARGPFALCALPFRSPVVPVTMRWHRRHDGEEAHAWLRTVFRTTTKQYADGLSIAGS